MSERRLTVAALVLAAVALAVVSWFDHSVVLEARIRSTANFELGDEMNLWVLGVLLAAGTCLCLGWLAWRAGTIVVSLPFVVVGGFFALLPWLMWNLATSINGSTPVLPQPLLGWVSNLYADTNGPLRLIEFIGAAMLLAGLASLAKGLLAARGSAGPAAAAD